MAGQTKRSARKTRVAPEQVRQQIVHAFDTKAKAIGLRGVMMGEIASELRISASTLYKHFPSKEALTLASVERWADEFAAAEAAFSSSGSAPALRGGASKPSKRAPFEQFVYWLDVWADAHAALSPAFMRDLETDYPAAFKRFRAVVNQRKRQGAALLRPQLKPELDDRVALAVLDLILTTVLRPEFADRLRISRHQAIRTAVAIWAGGALDRRGQLRALRAR